MALAYVTALRNAKLDEITAALGNACLIRIYNGSRPATGGTATTLLGTLTGGSPFAPAAASGVLTANAITQDSAADATGTATWFRALTSGASFVLDGDIGTSGSDLNLNTVSIVIGGPIAVTSFVITAGNP
jgi:hypothetical protein